IEDQTAIRDMLGMVLNAEPGYTIVGTTGNGHDAWTLCQEKQPDLVILDIMLPEMNGVEILRRIHKHLPKTRSLVFSGYQNIALVKATIRAGAHGFIEKTAPLAELKKGIELVANGGSYFGPAAANLLRDEVMNPRESRG